jgi:hypothetical protein
MVHLFWFESSVPSPIDHVALGLATGYNLYLRYKRGILRRTDMTVTVSLSYLTS